MAKSKLALTALMFMVSGPLAASDVNLEADQLSSTNKGVMQAEGNVQLKWEDLKLQASKLTYDSNKNFLLAQGRSPYGVSLTRGPQSLKASELKYNLLSGEGDGLNLFVQSPAGYGTAYFKAAKGRLKNDKSQHSLVYQLSDFSVTTCLCEYPAYALKSHEVFLVPGQSILIRRPQVWLWGSHVLTYPFDVKLPASGSAIEYNLSLLPRPNFSSYKGLGVSWGGRVYVSDVIFSLGAGVWSHGGFDASVGVSYSPVSWLTLKGNAETSRFMRPITLHYQNYKFSVGADMKFGAWKVNLLALWNEPLYLYQKGDQIRFKKYHRLPQVTVSTPWVKAQIGSIPLWTTFNLQWGRYKEGFSFQDFTADRWNLNWKVFTEKTMPLTKTLVLKLGGEVAQTWSWYSTGTTRRIFDLSLRADLIHQKWLVGLGYERRVVTGKTPFAWDSTSSFHRLYPHVEFAMTSKVRLGLQGRYNSTGRKWDWVEGRLIYDDLQCTRWGLFLRLGCNGVRAYDQIAVSFEISAFAGSQPFKNSLNLYQVAPRPSGLK